MQDELLLWCSERGAGSLDAFRDTYAWLEKGEQKGSAPDWRIALYNLQVLGHAEVDWEAQTWSVTPPVLTTMPNSGGHALLVGQRPLWLLQRLERLHEDPGSDIATLAQSVVPLPPFRQAGGPSVLMVTLVDPEDCRALCKALGIAFEDRAADQLARRLPRFQEMLAERGVQRGPGGIQPQKMSEGGRDIWTDVEGHGEPPLHGAYRYQRYNTHRYIYWIGTKGFIADKRTVVYAELARAERWVLRYSPLRQELYAPKRMQLPHLHARAAVLRSGLLPQLAALNPQADPNGQVGPEHKSYVKYVNIDEPFARQVAESLYQKLQLVP
ncbi:hypothetical protein AVW11_10900 [Streptomyces amritsarensis]|uniref:Uncharacterized protein n=1 Tax=Streptomyces amritsarensis TaxID=681158 RepID=A0ABX3G4S8_9ACTN|nr:hypothetical protein [Streptomyces amritsarensis]OLZ69101.1 hypothetical protein AVW11_10900 [Streptomyces amritsarensis]